MPELTYYGDELELFARAFNWKRYYAGKIVPRLGACVLEVGAGLAATTPWLSGGSHRRWLCLEPDSSFCAIIQEQIDAGRLPGFCEVKNGTTAQLVGQDATFDSILYIDVLEHIQDDQAELSRAARLLNPVGKIIVLAPAHDFLFSRFDRRVGHFRRYDRRKIRRACPDGLNLIQVNYLDSIGMAASLANRFLLRQSLPNTRQISMWDRILVRASKICDPLLAYRVGKSLLAIFRRDATL